MVDDTVMGACVTTLGAPTAVAGGAVVDGRVNGASVMVGGGGVVFFEEAVVEICGGLSIGEEGVSIGSVSSVELSSTGLFSTELVKNFSGERERLATVLC